MSREELEPLAWAAKGIQREEAARWWEAGFSIGDALRWRERFGAAEATGWRKAGVTSPAEARSWRVCGVDAGTVAGWRDAGIGFAEAAAWHEFGYSLDEARTLKAEGKTPSESFRGHVQKMRPEPWKRPPGGPPPRRAAGRAQVYFSGPGGFGSPGAIRRFIEKTGGHRSSVVHSYLTRQWLDDDALPWAKRGIDAADAIAWKELGITPAEAERLTKAGQTPVGTMRAWWDAGIPFDEVASWLGAGLTPAEAAEQRANGVTAEQAAVLRALRDAD